MLVDGADASRWCCCYLQYAHLVNAYGVHSAYYFANPGGGEGRGAHAQPAQKYPNA